MKARPARLSFGSVASPLVMAALLTLAISACGPVQPDPPPAVATAAAAPPRPPVTEPPPQSERRSTHLVLRLKARRLDLMKEDARVASFPIAIGRHGHETPLGEFHVEEMVVQPDFDKIDPSDPSHVLERIPPGPRNPLGERWIGFAHGAGWTVGIHGTPHPELLGQAVSGGCIRMRNADVIRVYEAVEIGTPVVVYP